jgi:soluble lytic murein transglycosylase-like protein
MDTLALFTACSIGLSGMAQCPQATTPVASTTTERPDGVESWGDLIAEASTRFALPQSWIGAVMRRESGGRTRLNGVPITSRAGAMGLMQVMPGTYEGLRRQYQLGAKPYDPRDNILAGTAYLRQMYERYGYPSMFAAYNAGPRRFDDFLLRGRPLPGETMAYVAKVVPGAEMAMASGLAPFNVPKSSPINAAQASRKSPLDRLFFALSDIKIDPNAGQPGSAVTPSPERNLFVALSQPHS